MIDDIPAPDAAANPPPTATPDPEPTGPSPETLASTAAVILAAGAGSRFHGDDHKLLSSVSGRPVVVHAIERALAAGFAETIVISGSVDLDDIVPDGVTLLDNHAWADGQARSLQVAVTWATHRGHKAIVVGLGDQPMIPTDAWLAVAASASLIATASFAGENGPPVKLSAEVWGLLPIEGDEGARSLIRRRPEMVESVACEGVALDVDTLSDLERVRRLSNIDRAKDQERP